MRSEKGFTPLIIIVIATLVIGVGIGVSGFLVLREKKAPASQEITPPPAPDFTEPISPQILPLQHPSPPPLLPTREISEAYDPKWLGEYIPVMKAAAANYDYADPDVIVLPSGGYRLYVGGGGKHQIVSFSSTDGINWNREEGVRVSDAAFPDAVLLPDNRVRIYFQQFSSEERTGVIKSVVSNDGGLTFVPEPGIRVSPRWHGELDADAVAAPSVVRLADGRYRMYYIGRKMDTAYANGMKHVILSAVSEDGFNFTSENGTRIRPEDWLGSTLPKSGPMGQLMWSYIDGPEAVLMTDGRMKLYFWGGCDGICLSISKDGLKFERVGEVFSNTQLPVKGNAGDPAILQLKDGTWLLFYNSTLNNHASIFIAKQKTAPTAPVKVPESQSIEYKFPPPVPFVDTSKDGPWNRDLWMRESSDGTNFGTAKVFIERAGVPSITKDLKGKLITAFQWFPENNKEHFDQVALVFSQDNGKSWSQPNPMKIANFPQGYMRPFDPTVIYIPGGKIRMYFTSKPQGPGQPSIFSAISDDGINYIFEQRERFGVANELVLDSAVGTIDNVWHLLSPINIKGVRGSAYHAESSDGLNFSRKSNIQFQKEINWIGNIVQFNNGLRFYGSGFKIWWTFTQNGEQWTEPKDTNVVGGDPAVLKLSNSNYLMIHVGQPKIPLLSPPGPL